MDSGEIKIAHVGLNLGNEEDAQTVAKALCETFRLDCRKGEKSIFCGKAFECLKIPFRGEKGHIALAVGDLTETVKEMEARGIRFDYDATTMYFEDGSLRNIYLHDEFAGFAVHIMQESR